MSRVQSWEEMLTAPAPPRRRYHIKPMNPEDFVLACATHPPPGADARDLALMHLGSGPAWALWDDDVLLAVAGVWTWGQRGDAWLVVAPPGFDHPIPLVRGIRDGLWLVIRNARLGRVQADCVASNTLGLRLLTALGFKHESDMPKAGFHGEDFVRVVLFPGETHG